jgi:hypothetical protein
MVLDEGRIENKPTALPSLKMTPLFGGPTVMERSRRIHSMKWRCEVTGRSTGIFISMVSIMEINGRISECYLTIVD